MKKKRMIFEADEKISNLPKIPNEKINILNFQNRKSDSKKLFEENSFLSNSPSFNKNQTFEKCSSILFTCSSCKSPINLNKIMIEKLYNEIKYNDDNSSISTKTFQNKKNDLSNFDFSDFSKFNDTIVTQRNFNDTNKKENFWDKIDKMQDFRESIYLNNKEVKKKKPLFN